MHWVHATAFFVLLGSGLALYLPALSETLSRRPLIRDIHVDTAIAWAAALLLIAAVGDRQGLRRTLHELDYFDGDDWRWLTGRRAPQGRFNAGQKLNTALTASFALLFAVSGLLIWLGERDTRLRFASTVLLHDGLMYISLVLVVWSPLPRRHPPEDAARTARDHDRNRGRRVGTRAPREVGKRSAPPRRGGDRRLTPHRRQRDANAAAIPDLRSCRVTWPGVCATIRPRTSMKYVSGKPVTP